MASANKQTPATSTNAALLAKKLANAINAKTTKSNKAYTSAIDVLQQLAQAPNSPYAMEVTTKGAVKVFYNNNKVGVVLPTGKVLLAGLARLPNGGAQYVYVPCKNVQQLIEYCAMPAAQQEA